MCVLLTVDILVDGSQGFEAPLVKVFPDVHSWQQKLNHQVGRQSVGTCNKYINLQVLSSVFGQYPGVPHLAITQRVHFIVVVQNDRRCVQKVQDN